MAFALLVAYLSLPPVTNLLSGRQLMNRSYDPLDLVNTYGAFGSVGRERDEIIFEGTTDQTITDNTQWREYEFKAKPGDPMRRPAIIAPYQDRIDWQIWFAAMESPGDYPWTFHFVWKLLHNDPGTLSLLDKNPFPDAPPHYIRARLYRYEFAPPGAKEWWRRELKGEWLPVLSADDEEFRRILSMMGLARLGVKDRRLGQRPFISNRRTGDRRSLFHLPGGIRFAVERKSRASCDTRSVPGEFASVPRRSSAG